MMASYTVMRNLATNEVGTLEIMTSKATDAVLKVRSTEPPKVAVRSILARLSLTNVLDTVGEKMSVPLTTWITQVMAMT